MNVILVSATTGEIQPTLDHLVQHAVTAGPDAFIMKDNRIRTLISGVGSPATAFALGRFRDFAPDDIILHAGICGSYTDELPVGTVVEVIEEKWADLGAEYPDGRIADLFELGLASPDQVPFSKGILYSTNPVRTGLRTCKGLTVNKSSGTHETILRVRRDSLAEVESMEGAAVFYAAGMMDLRLTSVRAVSNKVETRDRSRWDIPLAVRTLNNFIIDFLGALH